MNARETTRDWLRSYYAAIDQLQLEELERFLHERCEIRYATGGREVGRGRIIERTRQALGSLERIEHRLSGIWEEGDSVIFELEVTYWRKDGSVVIRPGMGIFVRERGLIREQRLFVNDAGVWR